MYASDGIIHLPVCRSMNPIHKTIDGREAIRWLGDDGMSYIIPVKTIEALSEAVALSRKEKEDN